MEKFCSPSFSDFMIFQATTIKIYITLSKVLQNSKLPELLSFMTAYTGFQCVLLLSHNFCVGLALIPEELIGDVYGDVEDDEDDEDDGGQH